MFEIPEGLNPALMGVAWLIGRWEGKGHGTWPGKGEFEFAQQIDFSTNGSDYLHYISQTFTVDEDGAPVEPLFSETGYWRPQADGTVEVVLTHPEGYVEVWAGKLQPGKIELTTDLCARTKTAELQITGGQRLYGSVESDLLWTWDRATTDVPLQPFVWARLVRA